MAAVALNGRNAESSGPCVVCRNFKHTTLIIYSNVTRFVCLSMLIKSVYEWGLKALGFLGVLHRLFEYDGVKRLYAYVVRDVVERIEEVRSSYYASVCIPGCFLKLCKKTRARHKM